MRTIIALSICIWVLPMAYALMLHRPSNISPAGVHDTLARLSRWSPIRLRGCQEVTCSQALQRRRSLRGPGGGGGGGACRPPIPPPPPPANTTDAGPQLPIRSIRPHPPNPRQVPPLQSPPRHSLPATTRPPEPLKRKEIEIGSGALTTSCESRNRSIHA